MSIFWDIQIKFCSDFWKKFSAKCEKCHFMVKEGNVLGYRISGNVLHVDQAKVEITATLLPPILV